MRLSSARRLALVAVVLFAPPTASAAAPALFELTDPRGDDHGGGELIYPQQSDDFERGELDLVRFAATAGDGGTWFEVEMARPVRRPMRRPIDEIGTQLSDVARLGFYNLNLDVYIDVDREPGTGGVQLLPGRRAELDPAFAWDRAVVLTPRPHEARDLLKRMLLRMLERRMRDASDPVDRPTANEIRLQVPEEVDGRVFFPNRVRVSGRRIRFFVPDAFLGGPARADWAYTVLVTGADLQTQIDLSDVVQVLNAAKTGLMILPVGSGRPARYFGGGRDGDEMQPPIVDLLVPAGASQEALLSAFDGFAGKPAVLPGVVPAEAAPSRSR